MDPDGTVHTTVSAYPTLTDGMTISRIEHMNLDTNQPASMDSTEQMCRAPEVTSVEDGMEALAAIGTV